MSLPLLSTKLHTPRSRANIVSRPRLTERLLAGVTTPGRFILLSGPAGFGKTTLLTESVAVLNRPIAWVSLDTADNDPIRFWSYLIRACQIAQPELGDAALALLQSPQPVPDEAIATVLINSIDQLDCDLILILDDYHTIQNQSIHTALAFLLDHLPDKLHLIVSTRVDPPWPLARLRARDQLMEIRAVDLRFTVQETAEFLNQVMGLSLSSEHIAALEARTEGWIASLQLAAVSMKGHSDVAGFIEAFTGSHVYVAEYLMEEVLEGQTEDTKAFLLKTSILQSLNAALCEAVTAHPDGQGLLKSLYQANLFVLPLDEQGQWFRYHPLFADLLKARLQQTVSKESIIELHQRAAAWYEQQGMMNEAMEHLLAAAQYAQAVRLLEKIAKPLILKGYFKTVEDWLRLIPMEHWSESPQTNMTFAWMYLMRRNVILAAPHIERLQALFSKPEAIELNVSLQGEWLALQSILMNSQGNVTEGRELAERALKFLPEEEIQVRTMTYLGLANAYREMLDYEHAVEAAEAMIQHSRAAGDLPSEVFGLSFLGLLMLQEGRLHAAHQIVSQGLGLIERTSSFSPFSATLYGELAQVHYHWHQLEEARKYFERSVQLSLLGGFSDAEIYHSVSLSRLFQMQGDLQASVQEIEKALERMQAAAPTVVSEEVIAQQVSVYLAVDRLPAAQVALHAYGFSFDGDFVYPALTQDARISHPKSLLYNSALRILLYLARTRHDRPAATQGLELASLLVESALRCQQLPDVLKSLLLRAQLHEALGNHQKALEDVAQAVELAEPEGFISIFLEEGETIAQASRHILKSGSSKGASVDYIQSILAAFPVTQSSTGVYSDKVALDESLVPIESLTPRELEVLQLIAAGHSNQTISDELVITLSAVKKHTGNIFRKLGVNSRTQAVLRGQQLGILSKS